MKKKLVLWALMAISSLSVNADILSVHCPLGCPDNPDGNDLVFAHVYALSNNKTTKFADWVAYEVDVVNFGDSPGRSWKADPLLGEDSTLEPGDYKGAHSSTLKADRGHQAPLASFAGSRYWSELNYLSNITPQHKDLNQGPWKNLEDAVRAAVKYHDSLFVITGAIYEGTPLQLPNADESHRVPSSYFKVIYNRKGESVAFVMKQSESKSLNFCNTKTPLAAVRSKLAFDIPEFTDSSRLSERFGC